MSSSSQPPSVVEQGRALFRQGSVQEAWQWCLHHIETIEGRDHAALTALLGMLEAHRGEKVQASHWLDQAYLNRVDLDASGLADLGGGYLLLGVFTQAKELLQQALERSPQDGWILGRLGMCHLSQRHYHLALPLLQQAVTLLPHEPALRLNLARTLWGEGHYAEALEACQVVAQSEVGRRLPLLLSTHMDILLSMGRHDEALALVEQHRSASDDAIPLSQLVAYQVKALCACSRHEEALAQLDEAVEQQPDDLECAHLRIGLAVELGWDTKAMGWLIDLLHRRPENLYWWLQLSQMALGQGHVALAGEAIAKARQLCNNQDAPTQALLHTCQAELAMEQEDMPQAQRWLQQAQALDPQGKEVLLASAKYYETTGSLKQAEHCFESMAQHHPQSALQGMMRLRRFPLTEEALERLERIARTPSIAGSVNANMLFSLAKAWEYHKHHDHAWALLHEANQAVASRYPADPDSFSRYVHRMISTFQPALFNTLGQHGVSGEKLVFVVGMPRSGTTLVEQILASHPQCHGGGEQGVLPDFIKRLNSWEEHTGSHMAFPNCIMELLPNALHHFARELLKQFEQLSPESARIVDKLPHNFLHVGLIHLLFPQASIIHCVRDVRDVALSNYFVHFKAQSGLLSYANDLYASGRHIRDYRYLMQHWHSVLPGVVLDVPYEALVEDTEHQARRMLDHMNLPWDPAVLDHTRQKKVVRTASSWQVRQPIYTSSRQRWKRYAQHLQPLERGLNEPITSLLTHNHPAPPPGLFHAGMNALNHGDWKGAEQRFRLLLKHHPEHAGAHHFLGSALFHQHRYRWALQRMLRANRLHSGHPSWYHNLAVVYRALDDHASAQQADQTAQQLEIEQNKPVLPEIPALAHHHITEIERASEENRLDASTEWVSV
ncbi:tetratricopeptide repeat-containing sulfotransferase family protein [Magnetococcus sp. PR-3]|uniref:tetratricopeptide repeat-containing sulfotransferase family protein n=1 Tax=Magnetococcus sp. PR-3 TaxID=3120355 RepID=UPI002FCE2359